MDITRTTLAVLFIGTLIVACLWILLPFLTPALWATTIVVTSWPLMLGLQARLGGKRWLAVTAMTIVLLMIIIVPVSMAVSTIMDKKNNIAEWGKSLGTFVVPPPPGWVAGIPIAGPRVAVAWHRQAALSREELSEQLTPHVGKALSWFASRAGSLGMMFVQFLLTVIISAVLFAKGEAAGAGVCRFARRLAGQQGEDAVNLSARAIRGVALGIVVTAVTQTSIGSLGLIVSGVPAPVLLTAVMFVLCLAQVGPALVLVPAVAWLYWKGDAMWGTVLLVFSVLAITIDNVVRPLLIRKGAAMPLVMVIAGVVGGLVAFGILGLFIGPVILAVTYALLESWVVRGDHQEEAAAGDRPAEAVEETPVGGT